VEGFRESFSFSATMGEYTMMKKTLIVSLCALFVLTTGLALAKEVPGDNDLGNRKIHSLQVKEPLPAELQQQFGGGPSLSSAAVDTFQIMWYGFDPIPADTCDDQGWTQNDVSAQIDTMFHVAGLAELDGGDFGTLNPLEGVQSVWGGFDFDPGHPVFCGWGDLPGYGNSFLQAFTSNEFAADSVHFYWLAQWDSEPDYDKTFLEYWDAGVGDWVSLDVDSGAAPYYDFYGDATEAVAFGVPADSLGNHSTKIRFKFISDGGWSDQDGLWDTDGAFLCDSFTVELYNLGVKTDSLFDDFEDETAGIVTTTSTVGGGMTWQGRTLDEYGLFGALYDGLDVLQRDECFTALSCIWGWFDDPASTNTFCRHGFSTQGAIPYINAIGQSLKNEVVSPIHDLTGSGSGSVYVMTYQSYSEMPLDDLLFHVWAIRSFVGGCPTEWRDDNTVYYGPTPAWGISTRIVGHLVEAAATDVQIKWGAWDMCDPWCGIVGTGACHSQGPLLDWIRLVRTTGPTVLYDIRPVQDIFVFQDDFSEDGTITGTARCDIVGDRANFQSPSIIPGDSLTVDVLDPQVGLGIDGVHGGASVYCYARAFRSDSCTGTAPGPADMESPDTRSGLRYPYTGVSVAYAGETWYQFRMDTTFTEQATPGVVDDRFCFDLNDNLFVPGDVVYYLYGTKNSIGEEVYMTRQYVGQGDFFTTADPDEAFASPMEYTVLPGEGYCRGGDILYVDNSDGGFTPAQLYWDLAFDQLGILEEVDRFDKIAPSSGEGNSLGGKVVSEFAQIIPVYKKILWNSGLLRAGSFSDGGPLNGGSSQDKADDATRIYNFLHLSTKAPGLYLSGDDIGEQLEGLVGQGALDMKSDYIEYTLTGGDHFLLGESLSPTLVGLDCFTGSLIAYGGCAGINDFDVFAPAGDAITEYAYPGGSGSAMLRDTTTNSQSTLTTVLLAGFSLHYIRNVGIGFPNARTQHLLEAIECLGNVLGTPVGLPTPQYVNYLDNNYPNPFNPTTSIRYGIKEQSNVSLKIYNVAGQLVRTLVNEAKKPAGTYSVTWDGRSNSGSAVSSGVYFYKLVSQNFTQTKKMVLLK
jgi:hypothetical protein